MNLTTIWQCLMALPSLVLPGLNLAPQTTANVTKTTTQTEAPARSAGPSPTATPTATPAARTAAPTSTPAPTATPAAQTAAASSEIASEQTCPGQGDVAQTAQALTCLTSNARKYHGLAGVSANSALMASAAAKAADMQSCGYGHTACGRTFNYWIQQKGYTGKCSGENIAMGQKTPREVFVAWMNSSGHRANILNSKFRDIGVAEASSSKGPLWVMQLGGC